MPFAPRTIRSGPLARPTVVVALVARGATAAWLTTRFGTTFTGTVPIGGFAASVGFVIAPDETVGVSDPFGTFVTVTVPGAVVDGTVVTMTPGPAANCPTVVRIAALVGVRIVFGVANRILYKMALVPMGHYTVMLAQAQNIGRCCMCCACCLHAMLPRVVVH